MSFWHSLWTNWFPFSKLSLLFYDSLSYYYKFLTRSSNSSFSISLALISCLNILRPTRFSGSINYSIASLFSKVLIVKWIYEWLTYRRKFRRRTEMVIELSFLWRINLLVKFSNVIRFIFLLNTYWITNSRYCRLSLTLFCIIRI